MAPGDPLPAKGVLASKALSKNEYGIQKGPPGELFGGLRANYGIFHLVPWDGVGESSGLCSFW